jgi:hypothetical protein
MRGVRLVLVMVGILGGNLASAQITGPTSYPPSDTTSLSGDTQESALPLHFFDVGAHVGGFVSNNEDVNRIFGTMPIAGVDAAYHLGSWPLALSTSVDFFGMTGASFASGSNYSMTSDLMGFDWRATLLLEPPPGTWRLPGHDIYFNPFVGGGYGYQEVDLTMHETFNNSSMSQPFSGWGAHAVAGVDVVFRRRFTVGASWLGTFYTVSNSQVNDLDLGGNSVLLDVNFRF